MALAGLSLNREQILVVNELTAEKVSSASIGQAEMFSKAWSF